jgi:D-glycero-D-manno-heptose 1,7-bisphosphate phosphatase
VLSSEANYPQAGGWQAPMYPEDLKILPGAMEAAKKLSKAGYLLFLISNQAAFAKGKCRLEDIFAVQDRFMEEVRKAGLVFTDMYYSYTHPEGIVADFSGPTFDRKPSPYFLKLAAARYGVDLSASWVVGDRDLDVECGQRAGTRTIRVFNPNAGEGAGKIEPTFTAKNLPEAVEIILGSVRS